MRRSAGVLLVVGLVGLPGPGLAKRPAVAVLDFGGDEGPQARAKLIQALSRKYTIVEGQRILDACDALGVTMTRGPNLARAAAQVGVGAVVGGAVQGRTLSLGVYNGKTGQVLVASKVPYPKGMPRGAKLVLGALRRAPKRYLKAEKPAVVTAPPRDRGPDKGGDPDKGGRPGGSGNLTFDPDPVIRGSTSGQESEPQEENPLEPTKVATPTTTTEGPAPTVTAKPEGQKLPGLHGSPRVAATVGLGLWKRTLTPNQQNNDFRGYSSGMAFGLGGGFKVRPLAFFFDPVVEQDSWSARQKSLLLPSIYSRLTFQTMLGLKSRNPTVSADRTFKTTLWELRWEVVGYDWNVLGRMTGPHVELGVGFGLMRFGVNWEEVTTASMPDASYKFFLSTLGAYLPILHQKTKGKDGAERLTTLLGAHARLDYRVVTDTGSIEEDQWYGPASVGGINLLVGLNASYIGIVARVEYAYTRYFYSFTDAEARMSGCPGAACKTAAAGALDVLHALMANVGYSF